MLYVLGCITQQHDLRLVVLAGVLCLFACATAMSLMARARAAAAIIAPAMWLAAAGLVAGCGIWGTHFVAMLAYRAGFPVSYDPDPDRPVGGDRRPAVQRRLCPGAGARPGPASAAR